MENVRRIGELTMILEATTLAYNKALEAVDLTQPDLLVNEVPGELLEMANTLQIAIDNARRQAAVEMLEGQPSNLAMQWFVLGLPEQLKTLVEVQVKELQVGPLRYGQVAE